MRSKSLWAVAIPVIAMSGCTQPSATQSSTRTTQNANDASANGASANGASANDANASDASAAHDHNHAEGEHSHGDHSHGEKTEAVAGVDAPTTKLAFSSAPNAIAVGKPATWTLKVSDAKTGARVTAFETEMTKKMHLVVVKNDLSWFNHVHPTLGENGDFVVTTTLPTPGTYKLYADYTPTGGKHQVPQHEFTTSGAQPSLSSVLPVPDKASGAWITKKVVAHSEGKPDSSSGATYQVALMPMSLRAGQDSMLHFQVRDAKGQPVKDLQPYLGAMGHCVILSSDTKKYLHSHPMAQSAQGDANGDANHDMNKMGAMNTNRISETSVPKSGGPDVIFRTNFPTDGKYKLWGQFMHKGKIITASFVVDVGAAQTKTKAKASNAKTLDAKTLDAKALSKTSSTRSEATANGKYQSVVVTADSDGYHPAIVNVKAGQEVRMTFENKGVRDKSLDCAGSIRIPALKQDFDLETGQKKEIVFTPRKGQIIVFECEMKMFQGEIRAQ